jgi:signal transduction histidine kinase
MKFPYFSMVLILSAVAALMWVGYLIRTLSLRRRARLASLARHAERERIARDLHDTLLQGIQALLFRLDRWSRDDTVPQTLRDEIAAVAAQSRTIIIDGRDRIGALRQHHRERPEILHALKHFTDQLCCSSRATLEWRTHGTARRILPGVYEQILDITREAIRNACEHAQATRIEVQVHYGRSCLEVEVKDNGCGIPRHVLEQRYSGHFGLLGMYERALEIRARLSHESGGGTRVTLSVHASLAYMDYLGCGLGRLRFRLFRRRQPVNGARSRGIDSAQE